MGFGRKSANLEVPVNMTPMIDCVFQLIIFFIVTIDMSQKELEELKLPQAKAAVPDKPESNRPIVNVDYQGRIFIRRELYYDPTSPEPGLRDPSEVKKQLAIWARGMKQEMDPVAKKVLPYDPLLIRADKNTPFTHVQKIMEWCGIEGVQIWKVELAAAEYKPEEG